MPLRPLCATLASVSFLFAGAALAAGPTPFLGDAVSSNLPNATGRIRVVDVNRDGALELVVGACDDASGDNLVATFSFDTALHAQELVRRAVSCPRDLLVQDFNGDGALDVFAGAWDGQGPLDASMLYGQSNAQLAAPARPLRRGSDHNWTGYLSVVDADDDTLSDIAAPYDNSDSSPTAWGMTVVRSSDFLEVADIAFTNGNPGSPIGAIDVNADGRRDVLFADVAVVGSNGAWRVVDNATVGLPSLTTSSRVIDYDGDGVQDLLIVDAGSAAMRVCLTQNGALCAASVSIPTALSDAPKKIAVRDLNRDGVKDFVVSAGDRLAFSVSRADGTYATNSVATRGGERVIGIVIADVDRNGRNDVVVAYGSKLDVYPGL